MMGEIAKRKKKGRPSKADLAARQALEEATCTPPSSAPPRDTPPSSAPPRDIRRSLRRRSFRYNIIDYDEDYLDDEEFRDEVEEEEEEEEEEEDEEEDERRREKKLKLVLKLNSTSDKSGGSSYRESRDRVDSEGRPIRRGRVKASESESEEEDERVAKKRRIHGGEDYEDDDEEGENDEDEEEDGEGQSKRGDYVPGILAENNHCRTPLPDKKQLELILDKLQKKDTYGVYAEPVDPEELPDYHDVIKHPMDFSTVRKKLATGSYSTLEQFESDISLISSNAMQYNSPDTIYHKQARAIKELAERKFQRLRIKMARLEKEPKTEPKSEQKDRPNSIVKKHTKKPFSRNTQEPVGSDFSSGATLATADGHNTCSIDHVGNFEKPSNNDGPIEGISSLADNNIEKADDPQSGKGVFPKFGRKSFVVDENRRATYNIPTQPMDRCELLFTTFESEKKQLIPVGSPGEYSYARSLARFAANLGPSAWRIASARIEQALPPGFKYGRGWIGEYEPLPNTVLVLKGHKDYPLGKNDKQPRLDGKSTPVCPLNTTISQQQNPLSRSSGEPGNMMVKRLASNCLSTKDLKNTAVFQKINLPPVNSVCPEKMGGKRVESNSASMSNQKTDNVAHNQTPGGIEMGGRRVQSNSLSMFNQNTEIIAEKQISSGIEMSGRRVQPNSPFMSDQKTDNVAPGIMGMGGRRMRPNSPSMSNQKTDNVACGVIEMGGRRMQMNSPSMFYQKTENVEEKQISGGIEMSGRRVQPNSPSMSNQKTDHDVAQKQPPGGMQMPTSRPVQYDNQDSNFLHYMPFKQQDTSRRDPEGLQNGNVTNNFADNNNSNRVMASSFPRRQDEGLSDPVLVMKMLNEKAQKQQNGGVHAHSLPQAMPLAVGFTPAAQNSATNRSQISTNSVYNATRVFYPQAMHSHVGLPFQAFGPQPIKVGKEAQAQNRSMVFPQSATNDLLQAPWRGLSPHTQQKQKQDTLPPDLNVAFQSSVDSQQPDLALQL